MSKWIALFRGINVGGKNILPMAELRRGLESLKLRNVQSYIQSGNVVFESTSKSSSGLRKKIGDCVEKQHGFRPEILVLGQERLLDAIEANPFPNAIDDPKTLHLFFLAESADQADIQAIESKTIATEQWQLTDHVFYLWAPDGIGRSKLAANAERHLGVATTARNYRTVSKIAEMIV